MFYVLVIAIYIPINTRISVRHSFIWATSWENLFMPYENNKDADQPLLFTA